MLLKQCQIIVNVVLKPNNVNTAQKIADPADFEGRIESVEYEILRNFMFQIDVRKIINSK